MIVLDRDNGKQYSVGVTPCIAFLHTSCRNNVVHRYLGMVESMGHRVDYNGSAFSSSSFPVELLNDGGRHYNHPISMVKW